MKKHSTTLIALFIGMLFSIGSVFLFVPKAVAQGFNVEISPAKINLTIQPGETHEEIFRIINNSGSDRTFYIYTRDFAVSNENGSPTFFEGQREVNEQYSLKEWVTLPFEQVKVLDQQTREIPVSITVPTGAEPGGHYAAVFFQTEDPTKDQGGTNIGSVGRIASLMLVTVPGDVEERMILQQFSTNKKVFYNPSETINVTTLLLNEGSVHGIPTGALFLTGGLNSQPKNIIYNQSQAAVLPVETPRKITESFVLDSTGFIPPMGHFTLNLVARYGLENSPVEGTLSFWVIPWKFLSISLLLLIAFGFLIWRVILSFRK